MRISSGAKSSRSQDVYCRKHSAAEGYVSDVARLVLRSLGKEHCTHSLEKSQWSQTKNHHLTQGSYFFEIFGLYYTEAIMPRKDTVELRWIWSVVRRWLWLIVLCTVLAMTAAFIGASWIPPVYSTSATLLVSMNSSETMSDYNTIVASERLVLTYSQLLTQRSALEAAIAQLGLAETPETLAEKVKATPVKDTQLILLSAEGEDPVKLAAIVNTIAENFATQIDELRQANLQGDVKVAITERAWVPEKPISRRTLYVVVAGLVGSMLAVGVAFLIEYSINTIKTSDDVSEALGLNTIGAIGRLARGEQELAVAAGSPSAVAEAFHTLCTSVRFSNTDKPLHTLLVTSPGPREGKSFTAANLAAAMAQSGLKVVAMDVDLRRPRLHQLFGLDLPAEDTECDAPWGLTGALLEGHADGRLISVGERLRFLPCGDLPSNPTTTINSPRMRKLLHDVARQADLVLVDSPPVLPVADAAALAQSVDGVLLVLKAGHTPREAARRAVANLRQVNANMVGVVLNGVSASRGGYYGYYNGYYGEGKKRQRRRAR